MGFGESLAFTIMAAFVIILFIAPYLGFAYDCTLFGSCSRRIGVVMTLQHTLIPPDQWVVTEYDEWVEGDPNPEFPYFGIGGVEVTVVTELYRDGKIVDTGGGSAPYAMGLGSAWQSVFISHPLPNGKYYIRSRFYDEGVAVTGWHPSDQGLEVNIE